MPRTALALAAAVLVALPCRADAQAGSERHTLSGDRVEVWNLAGRAELVAGSGREVVVELRRGGADGSRLTVNARNGRLIVEYPDRDIVYDSPDGGFRSEIRVDRNSDGTFSGGWGSDRDGGSVRVRTSGSGLRAHADLRIAVPAGQRVLVAIGLGVIEATNVNGDLELRTQASRIQGSGLGGALVARTGSGGIELANSDMSRLQVATGSGGLRLDRVKSGEFKASTGSGRIEGRELTADRFEASTGSGGIEIFGLNGRDVRTSTGSGGIRLELGQQPGSITASAGSGGVTLRLPAGVSAEVDARTGSGRITTDFPVTMDEVRRNSLRGRIGSGEGGRIRVTTGSGGIRLERH
ncbi:MAG: DUF4097 family beta strand repeat protein [Gemmatimonadaceae bacterium]|nr:DUF4097 family beta strand repeat protein [Gemmatimonadaceae bacterium]MCW5827460.1 DUF4097 family beta strand repeat protein [Gemmatimonadaceae bacterium]